MHRKGCIFFEPEKRAERMSQTSGECSFCSTPFHMVPSVTNTCGPLRVAKDGTAKKKSEAVRRSVRIEDGSIRNERKQVHWNLLCFSPVRFASPCEAPPPSHSRSGPQCHLSHHTVSLRNKMVWREGGPFHL